MKLKLTLVAAMTLACASIQLTAMPTEEETKQAEPVVKKMLAQERAALESGKKTPSEVAAAAMKLADETDTDAAKLLLMKGAFALYVKDGNLEKAVETMKTLEAAISDMPPQSVTNMIEMALKGASKKVDGARLYKLLDETTAGIASRKESIRTASSVKERSSIASILKGMIKVPGRDYWLSATELTQGQWESVMGYNLSEHKGVNLPVDNVSRDDCDVFLEKLNQTEEVKSSQFEFRLPELEEWKYAAWAGSAGQGSWIKPGVVGNVLNMAWVKENSLGQTHAVATKAPNAFGFYDMLGNVWEWLSSSGGDAPVGRGSLKGCAFNQVADECTWNANWHIPKTQRYYGVGMRLAAQIRHWPILRRAGASPAPQEGMVSRVSVGGYTWPFFVRNGEATIMSKKSSCAVSPVPTGNISIPATLCGAKVTSIGHEAFKNCTGLKSVTIPAGVKVIESEAFRNCKEMTSVTIPDGVTHIDSSAFADCGLTSVMLPSSVKVLGGRAFWRCAGLTSVAIPDSVTSIGDDAFNGCRGLKSVVIPDSVTDIGSGAFLDCKGLTSVTIPAKVEYIGEGAFGGCSGLKQINVAAGNKAFAAADGVLYNKYMSVLLACPGDKTSLTIPSGVTRIGVLAFGGCNGLKSVTIPQGVKGIGDSAFKGCSTLTSVTIPSGVTRILQWTFEGCSSLESVTIQGNVAHFGHQAFLNCHELTSFTMCGERPEAPNDIFQGCDKLKSIHVPANAKSWAGMKDWLGIPLVFDADEAESQLEQSRHMKVNNGIAEIKDAKATVDGNTWSYSVRNGEAIIENRTDKGYSCAVSPKLTGHVAIPSELGGAKVTRIGARAFYYCDKLKSLTIPEGVKSIDHSVFMYCRGLTSVKMPESVASIGSGAFYQCWSLTSVTIPSGVTNICDGAFMYCNQMRRFEVDPSNKYYKSVNGLLLSKDGASLIAGVNGEVVIPSGVKYIGSHAFLEYRNLKAVTIPEGVVGIGKWAFSGSGLAEVTIPSSVMSIGEGAFRDCRNLKRIEVAHANKNFQSVDGLLLSKDGKRLIAGVNGVYGEVNIPSCVTRIEKLAFDSCRGLVKLSIPASVDHIEEESFCECSVLRQFEVDDSNESYKSENGLLLSKDGKRLIAGVNGINGEVVIPSGVKSIAPHAFHGCRALTKMTIPPTVTNFGSDAFFACLSLKHVIVGKGDVERVKKGIDGGRFGPDMKNVLFTENDFPVMPATSQPKEFHGANATASNMVHVGVNIASKKLESCDFLLNKDFKKNAKYYLCLLSASWCGPCRREMPRIAKTYAETLKDDPNIELIHFSWDQNDEKALAWAKEHDVKFPVVKPKGGNPLDLHTRGIPHLFIVKADGTLIEEGHPMKLFTDEKLRELKVANRSMARATEKTGDAATELFQDSMGTGLEKSLVGYWPFDGNANDETRYRNNGTLHDVTPVEDRHGNANKAYRFNGSSYIEVPHSETLNMTHAITMTAWIKPQSWWANQWIVVMQKGDQRNVNYQFAMRIDDKVFLCGVAQGKCEKLGLELNKWQQVALTYESGKNLCFYRNGALIGKWQCSQDLQPNKGSLLIGYDPFGWTEHFIGDMDDVRLFNRALSEEEIKALYKAEFPTAGKEIVDGIEWTYSIKDGKAQLDYASSSNETGSITIPSTLGGCPVTSIRGRQYGQPGVFENCCMTSVTIPSSVTNIGNNAFSCHGPPILLGGVGHSRLISRRNEFNGLKSFSVAPDNPSYSSRNGMLCTKDGTILIVGVNGDVAVPEGVTSIGNGAFAGCTNLTSMTIPNSVTNIGWGVFGGCSGRMSILVGAENTNYRSANGLLLSKDGKTLIVGVNGDVTIPSSVTSIHGGAFRYCKSLTSVTIPNSVTNIENYAFYGCSGLTSVTIPGSVTSIGVEVFSRCSALTSVTIPNSVTNIGDRAFFGCTNLTSMTIPNSVTSIGEVAFADCTNLKSMTIPNSVTSIGNGAFFGCTNLTSMTIPNSVTSIGEVAFADCTNLKSVTIPDSVTNIGGYAFFRCSGLMSILVGSGNANYTSVNGLLLSKDGKTLVKGLNGDVVIPDSVTSIGDGAFRDCSGLTSVTIPNGVTSIGSMAFSGCTGLKSVMIPGSVTNIGGYAFFRCSSLTSVTIPDSVRSIGYWAFSGCTGLKSVTIPDSVTNIDSRAFYGCKNIASVDVVKEGKVEKVSFQDFCKQRKWEKEREAQRQAEREEQRRELEALKAELRAQRVAAEKARKARETAELEVEP